MTATGITNDELSPCRYSLVTIVVLSEMSGYIFLLFILTVDAIHTTSLEGNDLYPCCLLIKENEINWGRTLWLRKCNPVISLAHCAAGSLPYHKTGLGFLHIPSVSRAPRLSIAFDPFIRFLEFQYAYYGRTNYLRVLSRPACEAFYPLRAQDICKYISNK